MNDASPINCRNSILQSLTPEAYERWKPHLELIDISLGTSLYRPDEEITHVYFPENSMASIVANTSSGQSCEVGVVGYEGATGLQVIMGARSSPHNCMVQIADRAYRLPAAVMRREFNLCGPTHDCILSFMNKLLIQVSQTTLCNRLHSVEERLARWLLMCHDRVTSSRLELTQEFLAIMLGVTRVSVTISASALQMIGYIKYTRGNITIVDHEGLEDLTCECYAVVKKAYDRPDEVPTECKE